MGRALALFGLWLSLLKRRQVVPAEEPIADEAPFERPDAPTPAGDDDRSAT